MLSGRDAWQKHDLNSVTTFHGYAVKVAEPEYVCESAIGYSLKFKLLCFDHISPVIY